MKKSLIKKISLFLSGLLCFAGFAGVAFNKNETAPVKVEAANEKTFTIRASNSGLEDWTNERKTRTSTALTGTVLGLSGDDCGKGDGFIKIFYGASIQPELVVRKYGDSGSNSAKVVIKRVVVNYDSHESVFYSKNLPDNVDYEKTDDTWNDKYYATITPKAGKTVSVVQIGRDSYGPTSINITSIVVTYIETFTLTYNANGGTGSMPSSNFYYNESKKVANNTFTYGDAPFLRWNTKADGTGTNINEGATITKMPARDLTLYAIWDLPSMVVNANAHNYLYDGNPHGGSVSVTTPSSGYTVKYGTTEGSYTLDSCPTYTNVGEYTVYYQASASGYLNSVGSFVISINENNKTGLTKIIEKAEALYDSLDDKTTSDAIALNDAIANAESIYANQNVTVEQINEAINAVNDAIAIYGSSKISDETNTASIQTYGNDLIPSNVTLTVEVKTDVKASKGSAEREAIQEKIAKDEKIVKVFDVKLIKDEGGVKTEIQPSDIKEGMKVRIRIALPEEASINGLKVLHIHSETDIEFVENATACDGFVTFKTNKLSEIALINKIETKSSSVPVWGIILLVIAGLIALLCLAYVLLMFVFNKWVKVGDKAVRAFKLGKEKDGKVLTLVFFLKFKKYSPSEIFNTKQEALK